MDLLALAEASSVDLSTEVLGGRAGALGEVLAEEGLEEGAEDELGTVGVSFGPVGMGDWSLPLTRRTGGDRARGRRGA